MHNVFIIVLIVVCGIAFVCTPVGYVVNHLKLDYGTISFADAVNLLAMMIKVVVLEHVTIVIKFIVDNVCIACMLNGKINPALMRVFIVLNIAKNVELKLLMD